MKSRNWIALVTVGLTMLACSLPGMTVPAPPTSVEFPTTIPTSTPTLVPLLEPTLTPRLPPNTQALSLPWKEYRDARYGYGLALPCFWSVYPTPPQGNFATMTARNYDDAFFQAHSERGEWTDGKWPEGVMSLNVVVIEGIDPALTMEQSIDFIYKNYSSEQSLQAIEPVRYGDHDGVLVTVVDGLAGGSEHKLVYFPLGPDTLLSVVFVPDGVLDHPDAQAILASIATVQDETVTLPSTGAVAVPDPSTACP